MPTKYAEATLRSFGQLDHVNEFIEWLRDRDVLQVVDMSQMPVSHCTKATELHEWYALWVKKHGDKQDRAEALNLRDFCAALRDRGWVSRQSAGTRWVGTRLTQVPGIWSL
jgi:hypothetical protein